MLFIYCCLNWLVCAISWLWFFLCFMIAFVMHGNTSTPKISFFGLLCTNYDQLSCLQHSLRVLGLDMQVYKQICKCQITEGDAETGGKSDTFSKKQNKRHTKKTIAFISLLLLFPLFDFLFFPELWHLSSRKRLQWVLRIAKCEYFFCPEECSFIQPWENLIVYWKRKYSFYTGLPPKYL